MKNKAQVYFLIFFIISSGFIYSQNNHTESVKYLKSNLEFLASDELEGREATTRGEKIASLYIVAELEKYGVKPFAGNGSYFQPVEMKVSGISDDAVINIAGANDTVLLKFADDFVLSKRGMPSVDYSGIESEIIFAGYGITAPEFNYDDYNNIDVTNKIVLLYDNMPKSEIDSVFNPRKHRRYSSSSYKRENAQNHGAVAMLIIPTKETDEFWDRYKHWSTNPSFTLNDTTEHAAIEKLIPLVTLNLNAFNKLMLNEYVSAEKLLDENSSSVTTPSFVLKKKLKISYSVYSDVREARNVIGILEGNDPVLKNEYVTIGAHYDHIGKNENEVNNGADDDGSGTVAVLETARVLALEKKNNRSIVFVFHTGEEKGLLGSKFLTQNAKWLKDAVVNINIDMVGRESIDSIHCIGSDKLSTELYELVEEANKKGDYFTLDYRFNAENDPNRFYYRSDHVHYANNNIPIVFFFDYMQNDYHKSTDTVDKINFEKIYKITRLTEDIALSVANADHKIIVDKAAK